MTDLLRPRFEIIADFPNNNFGKVGTVLDRDWALILDDQPPLWKISDFPHLFRKLDWWEKRDESEMPMYLKHSLGDSETTYHKIHSWDMINMIGWLNERKYECCSIHTWSREWTYQPATEEEYNNSINQNQKP